MTFPVRTNVCAGVAWTRICPVAACCEGRGVGSFWKLLPFSLPLISYNIVSWKKAVTLSLSYELGKGRQDGSVQDGEVKNRERLTSVGKSRDTAAVGVGAWLGIATSGFLQHVFLEAC